MIFYDFDVSKSPSRLVASCTNLFLVYSDPQQLF